MCALIRHNFSFLLDKFPDKDLAPPTQSNSNGKIPDKSIPIVYLTVSLHMNELVRLFVCQMQIL